MNLPLVFSCLQSAHCAQSYPLSLLRLALQLGARHRVLAFAPHFENHGTANEIPFLLFPFLTSDLHALLIAHFRFNGYGLNWFDPSQTSHLDRPTSIDHCDRPISLGHPRSVALIWPTSLGSLCSDQFDRPTLLDRLNTAPFVRPNSLGPLRSVHLARPPYQNCAHIVKHIMTLPSNSQGIATPYQLGLL